MSWVCVMSGGGCVMPWGCDVIGVCDVMGVCGVKGLCGVGSSGVIGTPV